MSETRLVNKDGQSLFCRYWEPSDAPRGLVFVSHGAGEHSGRYEELAQTLLQCSLLLFSHDHVGHGQSDGSRMVVSDFQVYVRDCLQHTDLMRARHPTLPCFLLGHSMGGAISILAAYERPNDFSGLVLISPLIGLRADVATPFRVMFTKAVNYFCPTCPGASVSPSWLSRDPKEVKAYTLDPLVFHNYLSVRFVVQMLDAIARVQAAIPTITWPFVVFQGSDDMLVDPAGAQLLHEQASSQDKTIQVFKESYHVLHKELPEVRETVLNEITEWITKRLA
uniref:Monoglyceride lipase n=1 Tax=Eptatretus burgeri TaxID=7764 RepID=A0A8C4QPJ4_EPTBU